MKKLFLLILLLSLSCRVCCAADGISFIYINGSNNNDKKMTDWYKDGATGLHNVLKKRFEKSVIANKHFLKNGKYCIVTEPIIFFWGDHSKNGLSFLDRNLSILQGVSPWIAYKVRWTMGHYLHDTIWVQKDHNMKPILVKLHTEIKSELSKGHKVVLYGYSAGSFVAYEYLLRRLPYINAEDFFNRLGVTDEEKEFIKQNPMEKTCMEAFVDSKLTLQTSSGFEIINNNLELFKKRYLGLNKSTEQVCAPEGSVNGIVNFGSPLPLFYSDLTDPKFELTYYNRLLYKYIIENDMFWLTVNYSEDPMGYPITKNATIEDIEKEAEFKINPHTGFIYDWSSTSCKRPFLWAHTSLLGNKKTLAKAIVKGYENGYKHNYEKEFKKQCLNNREKIMSKCGGCTSQKPN